MIDEEDAHVAISVLTSCCKDRIVFAEFNHVVEFKKLRIEFNHFTPPLVVMRAPTDSPVWRARAAAELSFTTIAVPEFPATEGSIYGWVEILLFNWFDSDKFWEVVDKLVTTGGALGCLEYSSASSIPSL